MADPSSYRPRPGEVPTDPGVYRFRDEHGRVVYVGKAKNLRQRLANYFQPLPTLHPRTQQMVTTAASVQWTVVRTEVEALALEYSWIKEFDPRFNVKYRDDKSYPYLAVTLRDEVPRAQVMRGAKRPGTRYFGPYGHAWAIRETLDLLLRVFPVRTCSAGVYRRAEQTGRPCLLGYIDKCSAPCVGRISLADHKALAEDLCTFMSGDASRFVARLTAEMREAAASLEYERAARLRDDLQALERVVEKNAVVLDDGTDADIFALVGDELEAAVQVFHVRGGRIRGQRGWVVEKVEEISDAGLVAQLLVQVYGEAAEAEDRASRREGVPREVLVPELPEDAPGLTAWLEGIRGSRVEIRVPRRGTKATLAETVHRNAEQALALHRSRRAGDLTTRSQALREIQEALDLASAPLRIECFDVSTTQGTHQVASMVVFEDGLARKSEYRTFTIRGPEGEGAADDTAAMHEAVTRRFRRYLADREGSGELEVASGPVDEEDRAPAEERRRFAYPPHLVVVDGGQPQVAAAQRALDELGVTDVALCGLAKRLEEVWLPGDDHPVILERSSEGLYLLQRVRDEAHRFAIRAHRKRRGRAMTSSALDGVPGVGPARVSRLLEHFGSVARLRAASLEQVAAVPGMGPRTAAAVLTALGATATPASTSPAGTGTAAPAGGTEDAARVNAPGDEDPAPAPDAGMLGA